MACHSHRLRVSPSDALSAHLSAHGLREEPAFERRPAFLLRHHSEERKCSFFVFGAGGRLEPATSQQSAARLSNGVDELQCVANLLN